MHIFSAQKRDPKFGELKQLTVRAIDPVNTTAIHKSMDRDGQLSFRQQLHSGA
jgi:hypothetical protein